MFHLERANSERQVRWPTLVGLILVPLVIAGGFLWATWDSQTRLGRVQAAVVNLDQAVTINKQPVPLGRQLAGGLVDSEEENFSWVLTDATDAADGLAAGRYAAVVTITKEFSARATSYSKADGAGASPATLDVQTSQVTGIADPVVGQEIAAASRTLSSELTERYLDNIYLGFNRLNQQFATIASAAGKLSDGAGSLTTGIEGARDGSTALTGGLKQLDTGAGQLATGTRELSGGVGSLADGLQKLADGTERLPAQTRQLADGTEKSARGASQLAAGAEKLDDNLPALTSGTKKYAAGAETFADGMSDYRDGVRSYATGVDEYAAGVRSYDKAIRQLGDRSPAELATLVPCPDEVPDDACPVFYAGLQAGVQVGTGAAEQGLRGTDGKPGLLSGARQLATGADELSAGAGKLETGADQLSSGATGLSSGTRGLATGVKGLADGTDQLSRGLGKLSDGTDQLADGTRSLSSGISSASSGADKLATGARQLSTGAKGLADGTHQSAVGAGKLSSGLTKLSTGSEQLTSGATKLADGLKKGQGQVPTYDASARQRLSTVVASPVTAPRPAAAVGDVASASFLAVIALWVGSLASYLVLRAVSSRVLTSSRSSARLALQGLLPGAGIAVAQAVALTAVLHGLLDLSAARTAQLLPLAVLAGLAFVAVNHALVAWFGGAGRFVSLVLVVLSAAGAVTSAVPQLFSTVEPLLPLTPALVGIRAVVTAGPGVGGAVGLLLAWLVVGIAAGVLAVARRRVVSPLAMAVRA